MGSEAAMMSGGMNNWINNPFAYIMFLALFRNGGFGFNGDGTGAATQGIETQAQLNAIRTQLQDNQNADCIKSAIQGNGFAISQLSQMLNIDFNTLQKCCCDIQAAIQQVAGHVNFSADLLLQNCKDTSEIRNGQRDLGFAITQGFSATAFQAQQDKCDILRAGQDNTQRIIDTLNNHWKDEQALKIQDLKFELSQERQNNLLLSRLGGNGCGCNNSCECGRDKEHKDVVVESKISTHHGEYGEHEVKFDLPYEQAANALMYAKGYSEYVKKHGYHFTDALAEHVSKMMVNASGQQHSWTTNQVKKSMESLGLTIPKRVTHGDAAYLANMYYADLYPDPLKDEASCLRAAYKIANDPDGYDGMIFCRWTAGAIGKAIKLDWEKFV